jgi:effector-binding domain-containing protein
MHGEFEIKILPVKHTLYLRTTCPVGEIPAFLGRAYGNIMQYLEVLGEKPISGPYALYHNLDMQALDIEAGFPVAYEFMGKGDIKAGIVRAGKYASTLHTGPYDQMEPTYTALQKWVEGQGEKPTGEAYEWYFSPPETPPELTLTEVWFPLI